MKKLLLISIILFLNITYGAEELPENVIFNKLSQGCRIDKAIIQNHFNSLKDRHEERVLKLIEKQDLSRKLYFDYLEMCFLDFIPSPFKLNYFITLRKLSEKEAEMIKLIMFDKIFSCLQ